MSSGEYSKVRAECPHCKAVYTYGPHQIDEESQVACQNCGHTFAVIFSEGVTIALPVEEYEPAAPRRYVETYVSEAFKVKCPHCTASYVYQESDRTPDGFFLCQNCGKPIDATIGSRVEIVQTVSTDVSNDGKWIPLIVVSIFFLIILPWYIALPVIVCLWMSVYQTEVISDRKVLKKSDQGLAID